MNERIKELIKQATEHDYTTWDSYNQKELVYYKFNQEKFAELIVQEMCQVIDADCKLQYSEGVITNLGGLNQARELIKQHFGVEE